MPAHKRSGLIIKQSTKLCPYGRVHCVATVCGNTNCCYTSCGGITVVINCCYTSFGGITVVINLVVIPLVEV